MKLSLLVAALCLVGASGCGGHASEANDAGTPPEFVAVQGDFASYKTWKQYDGGTEAFDGLHVVSQRTLYINQLPRHGSKTFPVGTIIVKDTDKSQTFAMVKRGGGFNAMGAVGWEWFELSPGTDGKPVIIWRGDVPPPSQNYGNTLTSSCNGCHIDSSANDYVAGSAIELSAF